MKKLLNTLFVLSEDAYLILDGENVKVLRGETETGRFPLHTLEGIFTFAYPGASPALMGACAKRGVNLCFHTPNGRFLARTVGASNGNVLLRRAQYRVADDPLAYCKIARAMVFGKVYNARWSVDRTLRDHAMRVDAEKLRETCRKLSSAFEPIVSETDMESLRGLEGAAAAEYFGVFDEMILGDKKTFFFQGRNRRPPLDNVNAMLSFVYSILSNDCASALEAVGLDSFVGFMHRDRPGRASLALDLMEELRPCLADRFVLTAINNRMMDTGDFIQYEGGAVTMTDDGRRKLLKAWQERKREVITHPYLGEKLAWGIIPYVQALLLARCLRGDLDQYPPFLWK
ncbi:MAG: type I-C CRISPR-associated endonuclease Cas1c [Oscillospiraceae bacterium]|nr:type I-C CRISPR-associated endonuclease Cas1c [Oscillospiraceae bacterium]